MALGLGLLFATAMGNPYLEHTRQWTHRLLALSVIGLGAGMNLIVVSRIGLHGLGYTVIGISGSLMIGYLIQSLQKSEPTTATLISVGTAICGGSAIAALAPVLRAKPQAISIALGTVFLLNSAALILFPWLGHTLHLTERQFGLWSALAIHDTSSVVGATLQYGNEALQVGTTVKLARALWIVPVTLAFGAVQARSQDGVVAAPKKPWFILGFLIMAAIVTFVPTLQTPGHFVEMLAKRSLVLTLFLIGTNLTWLTVRGVGTAPLVQGLLMWILVASATLAAILTGWIR
jgi:uncharacterized membrane protein YadS